jgi:ATP-dependent Clp protease protease subunit
MPKKVNIKGPIVGSDDSWIYDWFGMEHTTPAKISQALEEANGEELEIDINSPGGLVDMGSEIYTLIKSYKGKTTARIVGIAASAASVVACGADVVEISPTAQIMIHNVSSMAWGDHRALRHEANVIENYNKSIANAYILKTGKSNEELLALMGDETWFTAQQAVQHGFADKVMFDDEQAPKLVASITHAAMLPQEVVDKMRNERAALFNQQHGGSHAHLMPNPHDHSAQFIAAQQNIAPPQETQPDMARRSLSFYQKKLNLMGRVLK